MKLINGLSIMLEGWNTPRWNEDWIERRSITSWWFGQMRLHHNPNEISEVLWAEPYEVKRMMMDKENGKTK